jgi:hypothetical protein
MKEQPPTYETHDYSAVEEHIGSQSERKKLANRAKCNALFSSYLKYGSMGIVSLGVFAFLLLWGVSLFKDQKVVIVEKEVIVEKPTKLEVAFPEDFKKKSLQAPEESSGELIMMRERINELTNKLRSQPENTEDKVDVTTGFVIFRRAKSNVKGFSTVHTGLNYSDSKQEYPFSQYCYIMISKGGDEIKVDLGDKSGRSQIKYEPFHLLKRHGLSRGQYNKLIDKCKFLI